MGLQPGSGPLAGLLVLDFGQAAVGPIAATYLGMMGATAIKIEQPSGDMVRRGNPTMKGTSTTFIGNNLTKYGIVLDLKAPKGHEAVKELIAKADVLIENFRSPAIMERLGLGYDQVLAPLNPRLIYVQSSAFGATGPWTGMFSDEWMTETVSGSVSMTGVAGKEGEFTRGSALLDWNGAMVNAVATLAALFQRERTGRGMMIRASQFGSSIFSSLTRLAEFVASGTLQGPMGSASAYIVPDQAFRAADGFVNVCVPSEKFWPRFCMALGKPDLASDPRFAANVERIRNRAALVAILEPIFAQRTVEEWCRILLEADVPCGSNPPRESLTEPQLHDAQVKANEILVRVDSAYGPILTAAPHWEFEKTPATITRPSPLLGEHTEFVLDAIGEWKAHVPAASGKPSGEGALAGIRVVEFAEGVPGPLCGMVLAQLGAAITRVEAPHGDWLRAIPPLWDGAGAVYRLLNAEKTVVTADLKSERGRDAMREIVRTADAVVVGFRAHKLERLGISYEQIRELNPAAVYCRINGWGTRGPRATAAATELAVQAIAGMHRYLGRNGEEPVRFAYDLASIATGLSAVQALLAGLVWRAGKTEGQRIDVSMLAAAIAINQWSTAAESAPDDPRIGRQLLGQDWPPEHGFATREGRCLIGFRQEDVWRRFAVAIGRVDLLDDPSFEYGIKEHPLLVADRLDPTLRSWPLSSIESLVRGELGGTVVPVLDLASVIEHPQVQALGIIDRSDGLRVRLPLSTSAGLVRE